MRELIDVNSMAVCALQQGRPKRALDLPSAALASLKDHFANRQQQELVHESNSMSMMSTPTTTTTDRLFVSSNLTSGSKAI